MNIITVSFKSHCGRFATLLTADFPEGTPKLVSKLALASLQTDVGDAAICKHFRVGKGTKKLPGLYESRDDVPYNDGNARAAESAVEARVQRLINGTDEVEGNPDYEALNIGFKVTGEYVYDEKGSPMVQATNFVDTILSGSDDERATAKQFLGMLGYKGEIDMDSRVTLIEFAHAKGLGMRK
jgi:hypothetical protein